MAWVLSGVALLWLGLTRTWYALLWWLFSTPVRNWNGHVHRVDPPPEPLSWMACVALGALTTLWFVYKVKADRFLLLALGTVLVLGTTLGSNFIRCRCQGPKTACKSNLKNLATALEMYRTDYEGKYPAVPGTLTPAYLKTIPRCPASQLPYVIDLAPDAYTLVCRDVAHYNRRGYPQYTCVEGLLEPVAAEK